MAELNRAGLEKQIAKVLNAAGIDNDMNIPDYILAEFICDQLDALKNTNDSVERHNSK